MEDNYWTRRQFSRRRMLRAAGLAAGLASLGPILAACGGGNGNKTGSSAGSGTTGSASQAPKASAPGVTADTVTFGTTFALTGPYSSYDPVLQLAQAYIQKTNDEGGVNGRKIKLQVEDDAYTPANTVPLAKKLVEQDKVFGIVIPLGTPPNSAVVDYYNEQKIPHLYPVTGANAWGEYQKYPWTVGFLPAYAIEGRIYGKYITQTWPGKKVGVLYQNDDYGKNYLTFKETLGKDNPIVDEETYESTASDVSQQVTNLKGKGAEVFILIAVPKFAGLALKAAADQNWKPNIIVNSVAADPTLFSLAGGPQNVEGAISDGWWVPYDGTDLAVQQIKDLIAKYTPNTQIATFAVWGYVAGQLIVETLKRAGANPTRESLLAAAESFKDVKIDGLLPGITVSTAKNDHEPIKAVKLNKATNGKFVYFGDVISSV